MNENITPYFIGLWLGDGFLSLNMNKYWKFGIVCSEFNYEEIFKIVNPTRIKEYKTKDDKYKYYELFTGNKEITSFLLDNCGSNAKDKHLPSISNEDDFWEVFSGLIDSDGTVDKKSYSILFLNSNKNLIEGVSKYLDLYKVEYSISIRKSGNVKWSDIYALRLSNKSLCKTKLNLRVTYKREAYEFLKKHSKIYVDITDEQFSRNRDYLKSVLSRSTFYFFDNGIRKKRVSMEIFNHMVV